MTERSGEWGEGKGAGICRSAPGRRLGAEAGDQRAACSAAASAFQAGGVTGAAAARAPGPRPLPAPPHGGGIRMQLRRFRDFLPPPTFLHHPRRAPRLPENQQVRSWRSARREPGGSEAAHAAPQQRAPLAAARRLGPRVPRATRSLAPRLPAAPAAGSPCGHTALFSPHCHQLTPPRRDKIGTPRGPREPPGKGRVSRGAAERRWRAVAGAGSRHAPGSGWKPAPRTARSR